MRIHLAALLLGLAGSARAQDHVDPLRCSVQFAARAEWLRATDGNAATAELMSRHAKLVFVTPPGDWGMFTGFGTATSTPSEPPPDLILNQLAAFAAATDGRHLPPCIDDPVCRACTRLMQSVAKER